jgi:hypothetical protein
MTFANKYISKQLFAQPFIKSTAHAELKIAVIIPIYREANILACLHTLDLCKPIKGRVEMILLINSSERDDDTLRAFNMNTFNEISSWIEKREENFIDFHIHLLENLPAKSAGVGLARKIAMDEALQRFESINRPDGVIVSLDADTLCEPNYFTSIEAYFSDLKNIGCSIYFEHPVSGAEYSKEIYKSSAYYELYLRYYINALRYIGHPHAYHCIGSAFAVRAKDYAAQGGMNKKQAGEDFYFLQKIISQAKFGEINNTVLVPSSRLSDRTPFGTGRSISDMCEDGDIDYKTFAFDSFEPLKQLLSNIDIFYKSTVSLEGFPTYLVDYLNSISFIEGIDEINRNCASIKIFRDKFYRFLNIFKILKYLNYMSENKYAKESVITGASKLLNSIDYTYDLNSDVFNLLSIYRDIDRKH